MACLAQRLQQDEAVETCHYQIASDEMMCRGKEPGSQVDNRAFVAWWILAIGLKMYLVDY
jgi:hypothetical protein